MKRFILYCALMFSLFMPVGETFGVNVKLADPKKVYMNPGTAPEGAFPLVCYIMSIRQDDEVFYRQLNPEAMKEHFPNGLTVPVYAGYVVFDEQFYITEHWRYPDEFLSSYLQAANNRASTTMPLYFDDIPDAAPRWSWNGVIWLLRFLALHGEYVSMAYTYGLPPDPDYVPVARKTVTVTPDELCVYTRTMPTEADPTIINLKPGMKFKLLTKDLTLE